MSWSADSPAPDDATDNATGRPPVDAIDVRALAEKVYRLMLAEARLELARGGRVPRSGD